MAKSKRPRPRAARAFRAEDGMVHRASRYLTLVARHTALQMLAYGRPPQDLYDAVKRRAREVGLHPHVEMRVQRLAADQYARMEHRALADIEEARDRISADIRAEQDRIDSNGGRL